jgi:hypothetical protein
MAYPDFMPGFCLCMLYAAALMLTLLASINPLWWAPSVFTLSPSAQLLSIPVPGLTLQNSRFEPGLIRNLTKNVSSINLRFIISQTITSFISEKSLFL